MGKWTPYTGGSVFTANAALGVWTQVDLSATIGSQRTVIVLGYTGDASIATRPSAGDARIESSLTYKGSRGMSMSQSNGLSSGHMVMIHTDFTGRIDYQRIGGADTPAVFLLGYFIPDVNGSDYLVESGITVGTSWTSAQASFQVRPQAPYTSALTGMIFRTDDQGGHVAMKPYGELSPLTAWRAYPGTYRFNGVNGFRCWDNLFPGSYYSHDTCMEINEDYAYERIADTNTSIFQVFNPWSEYTNYIPLRQTIYSAHFLPDYSMGYLPVDLSPYIGSREALVFLRVGASATSPAYCAVACRPFGSLTDHYFGTTTTDYGAGIVQAGADPGASGVIACPTDSSGRIEIAKVFNGGTGLIDVELIGFVHGYDAVSPSISADSISPSGVHLSLTAPERIRFRLDDPSGSGIDTSTFSVIVSTGLDQQITLVSAGALASGIAGHLSPEGAGVSGSPTSIEVVIDWPETMNRLRRYTVNVVASNEMGLSI